MSAVVTVLRPFGSGYLRAELVEVPKADRADVNTSGYLRLYQGYGDAIAVFKPDVWTNVVIRRERGADGKFIKKGA